MEPQHKHNSSTPNHLDLLLTHFYFSLLESSSVKIARNFSDSVYGLLPHIVLFLSLFAIVGGGLSEGFVIRKGGRFTVEIWWRSG